jgi:N-acetylglucosamine-6-sulfatase
MKININEKSLQNTKLYNRRNFLKKTALIASPLIMKFPQSLSKNKKKRNIIFILIDDMRYDAMSYLGHPILKTPNLDHLAKNGILFKNGFVTTSLCSPSRASIITSLYAHKHCDINNSTTLPKMIPTFPVELQKLGYKTGFIGKWHMGNISDDPQPGFNRWVSFRGQGVYFNPLFNIDGKHIQREGYTPDITTEYSIDFIRKYKNNPFFLYMSHKAVHALFEPAPRHKGKYSNVTVPKPKSFTNTPENYKGKPEWVKKQRNSWHGVDGMYDHQMDFDQFYKDYCECVLGVDDSIGELLDILNNEGLLEDTLIIFMGDNGFLFGEHGLIDKRAMYEPSIKIPLIVHCPELAQKGQIKDELVLNIDIAPTILDVAGIKIPFSMHGKSFLPLIKGSNVEWRKEFLYEYFWEREYPQTPTVTGLRTTKYSYMKYYSIWDQNELYDVEKDPDQMNNLLGNVRLTTQSGQLNNQIKDPNLKKLVLELEEKLLKIITETDGTVEPTWKL